MQIEPQISFHSVESSEFVENLIKSRIEELEKFHPGIIGCRVVVAAPHHHKRKGTIYEIRIDISVPGKDIIVTREAGLNHAHEDINVAIRDSFDAARRLLEDQVRKMSGHRAKHHPEVQHGHVVRIFAEDGYGFIEMEDGHEVYFDRESLTKPFWPKLEVGSKVRFKELEGDKGPYGIQITLLD